MPATNSKETNVRNPRSDRVSSKSMCDVCETDIGAVALNLQRQNTIDKDMGGEEDGKSITGYRDIAQRWPWRIISSFLLEFRP
jgi:hypothetical protein